MASCRSNDAGNFALLEVKQSSGNDSAHEPAWTQQPSITTSTTPRLIRQGGQGMVEYAFILVLIALVVVVMLVTTGGQVLSMYSDITYTLHNQAGL